MQLNNTVLKKYTFSEEKTWEDVFSRVSKAVSVNDTALQKRIMNYLMNGWFTPASPILINAGTNRGLEASCFQQHIPDSINDIYLGVHELGVLSKAGAGVGTDFSHIRGKGSPIQGGSLGKSTGLQPFLKLFESAIQASRQAEKRRGSCAVYLRVDHPDILDFLKTRETTGDMQIKTPNLFTAVIVPDSFMEAVKNDTEYELIDPHTGNTGKYLRAKSVFKEIIKQRHSTGLPYIYFVDNANRRSLPKELYNLGLKVNFSNLCSEQSHCANDKRSGVCVLSSINLSKYNEWKDVFPQLVRDIVTLLDNVTDSFIEKGSKLHGFEKAIYSAQRTREIGIGWSGFHDYLLSNQLPFDSFQARNFDNLVTSQLREYSIEASKELAKERGGCPDSIEGGTGNMRNIRLLSMMPTQTTSQIVRTSKSIEPYSFPSYTLSTDTGNKTYRIRQLEEKIGKTSPLWQTILESGTVRGLLDADVELLFRNAYEISQESILSMAVSRQKNMSGIDNYCHGQSINLFYPAKASIKRMAEDLIKYWEDGGVAVYYTYSSKKDYKEDECIACSA